VKSRSSSLLRALQDSHSQQPPPLMSKMSATASLLTRRQNQAMGTLKDLLATPDAVLSRRPPRAKRWSASWKAKTLAEDKDQLRAISFRWSKMPAAQPLKPLGQPQGHGWRLICAEMLKANRLPKRFWNVSRRRSQFRRKRPLRLPRKLSIRKSWPRLPSQPRQVLSLPFVHLHQPNLPN
jgi:hypothetical protein